MTARTLLRLEDKVRSETRRLARLGEPPSRRSVAIAWTIALGAHVIALGLPLISAGGDTEQRSVPPLLPTVWRLGAPRPSEPVVVRAPRRSPASAVRTAAGATLAAVPLFDAEPVPEPVPVLSMSALPSEIETLIPDPDPSARGLEPALTPRSVVTTEPKLLRRVAPTYPAAARALGASGSVTLEVWIREDGSVEFARVVSCTRSNLGFEQSALLAVREWTYDPAPVGTGPRTATVRTDFARDERRP
jgi:TonB family protein